MNKMVFIDLESTGVDPYRDRIIEVAILSASPNEERLSYVERVQPGRPIPAGATEVHGITDAMVADCPPFHKIAPDVQRLIEGAVIVGYNSRRFDVPLLHSELMSADCPGFPVDAFGSISIQEIDLFLVWKEKERRNLATAAKRFAGIDHTDRAHTAEGDAEILSDIMAGIRGEFDITNDDMLLITTPENSVDRDGKFAKDALGKMVFTFGKHIGKPVSRNLGYLEWLLKADFSPETKSWARRFLEWGTGEDQP